MLKSVINAYHYSVPVLFSQHLPFSYYELIDQILLKLLTLFKNMFYNSTYPDSKLNTKKDGSQMSAFNYYKFYFSFSSTILPS